MSAIAELFIVIFGGILELFVGLITLVFSSSILAKRHKGVKRVIYLLAALSALHLILGLAIPAITGLDEYVLSPIFATWAMITSLIIILASIPAAIAIHRVSAPTPTQNQKTLRTLFSSFVMIFVIIGGSISIYNTIQARNTLKDDLCAATSGEISLKWVENGKKTIELAGRVLGRDQHGKPACP